MDVADIHRFLERLGCQRIRVRSNTVDAQCPLHWKHSKGTDNKPSFGVSIRPGSTSHFNCFSCHSHGTLLDLVREISDHNGTDLKELHDWLILNNAPNPADKRPKRFAPNYARPSEDGKPTPLPPLPVETEEYIEEEVLKGFRAIPQEAMEYLLKKRRLTRKTIEAWELGWHEGSRRIVIPIRARKKDVPLVGLTGRSLDDDARPPKYLHSKGFRTALHLYGEHKARTHMPVFLCEGFFDVMYLWQCGYNAVAVFGSNLSKGQLELLLQLCPANSPPTAAVSITTDGDGPGYEAAKRFELIIKTRESRTRIVPMPEGKDPDQLTDEELETLLGPPQFERTV